MEYNEILKNEMKNELSNKEIKKLKKLNLFHMIFNQNITNDSLKNIFKKIVCNKYSLDTYIEKRFGNKKNNKISISNSTQKIIWKYFWKNIDYKFCNNIMKINDYKIFYNIFLHTKEIKDNLLRYMIKRDNIGKNFVNCLPTSLNDPILNKFIFLRMMYMDERPLRSKYIVPYDKEVLNFPVKEIKEYLEEKKRNA